MSDPIIVAYEVPIIDDIDSGNQIFIVQFENLDNLKAGKVQTDMRIPRTRDSKNEGSPSFELISFTGNIKSSSFTIFYEYQSATGQTYIAKGKYTFDGVNNKYKWETFPAPTVNDLFLKHSLLDSFGSRSKFIYQDAYYYLMETSKYDI